MKIPEPEVNGGTVGSWLEWQRHVLLTLKDLQKDVKALEREFWLLKGMSLVWGGIGGVIAAALISLAFQSTK